MPNRTPTKHDNKTALYLLVAILGVVLLVAVVAFAHEQHRLNQPVYEQGVKWYSCKNSRYKTWFSDPLTLVYDPDLQCATLDVPLDPFDYKNPATITLALTRLPATALDARDLLYIQGGPGFDGLVTSTYLVSYNPFLRENFNIIGYAPRGISPSTPAIDCRYDDTSNSEALANACYTYTDPAFLEKISTRYASEDVESIRMGLKLGPLNAMGTSYGTKVLNFYVQNHGDKLRAGIFDGVVDVTLDPVTDQIAMAKSFQNSFERFAQACRDGEFGDCVLADLDKEDNTAFHILLRQIEAKKLTDSDDDEIDGDDVVTLLMDALYLKDYWQPMHDVLITLTQGKTDAYNDLKHISDYGNQAHSGLTAINCADYASPRRHDEAYYLATGKKIDDATLFDNYRPRTKEDHLDACRYWRADGTDTFEPPKRKVGTPPLLFVSFAHDPATPHAQAKKMADALGGTVITRTGDGHGAVFSGSECVDTGALMYLLYPNSPPKKQLCID